MASEDSTTAMITNRENVTLNAGEAIMLTIGSDELVEIRGDKSILVTQVSDFSK